MPAAASSNGNGTSDTTSGRLVLRQFDYSSLSGTLNGSGSTFQKTFDEAAIAAFADVAPGLTVNYQGVGSGQGKKDLAAGTIDWAGTDSKVSDADMGNFPGGILYFPTVAAPITVSYNLSGVDKLQLSPDTLAGIFMGEITTWNDPKIAADNPRRRPAEHRHHRRRPLRRLGHHLGLLEVPGQGRPERVHPRPPATPSSGPSRTAGKGNPGVAQIITQTDGAIGYVDYSDAKASGLTFAAIKNKAGELRRGRPSTAPRPPSTAPPSATT